MDLTTLGISSLQSLFESLEKPFQSAFSCISLFICSRASNIEGRGFQVFMPHCFLDYPQIGALFHHMDAKDMPQTMDAGSLDPTFRSLGQRFLAMTSCIYELASN
jgi:hypothetical protein